MQKSAKNYLTFLIFLTIFMTSLGGAIYFFIDYPRVKMYIKEILLVLYFVYLFISFFSCLIFITSVTKIKSKKDHLVLDITSENIQEAYNFGELTMIITDDKDKVIWFKNLTGWEESKIIDKDLFELIPELKEIKENKLENIKLKHGNDTFLVKYLSDANLYILKNITQVENLSEFHLNNSACLGLIVIDNYQDIALILDDTAINDSLARIQKIIIDYAKEHQMLIKKYRNDSFIVFCNYENFNKVCEEGFDILKTANDEKDENRFTLSIGFSSGTEDFIRLFDLATNSLDLALARGGNQAVVSNYNQPIQFFGGTTEVKERRSSVESRTNFNSLKALIEEAQSIYVQGHNFADLDAIGASLGIYAIATKLNKKVKIIYDRNKYETKAYQAFEKLYSREEIQEMTVTPAKAIDEFKINDLLVVVDAHNPKSLLCPELAKKSQKVAIIDHHRKNAESINSPKLEYIDASASSASELIAEMISHATVPVKLDEKIATMLLGGIILDTNHYRNHIGLKTYDASYVLKEAGADPQQADEFLQDEFEEQQLKIKIMSNIETVATGIVVSWLDDKANPVEKSALAKVANELLEIKGINASFVVGRISVKEIGISARSDGSFSCQRLCESLGGGGSLTSAAVTIIGNDVDDVRERLKEVIDKQLTGK